ncbi:MAG: TetR/AcrR family transcriptional regulator [Pseudomonas sp.]|uniref:TetR/AcrR family transcriptional regulator n=1 Tax=Pseudomonas sp. TaxID=306 RepID=UPI00339796BA
MVYRTTVARLDRDLQLRAHILTCALQRVAEGGFAALTMQALAEDAGIATGSLYRHFQGKGELAAEVFSLASEHELQALGAVLRGSGSPVVRLRAGLQQFASRAWHSRQLAFALIAEPVDPAVDDRRLCYREAYAALFVGLIEEGVQQGLFRPGPLPVIAACLVGAISESLVGPLSPAARAARDKGLPAPDLNTVSHCIVTFCLRAVGAEEPTP